MVKDITIEDVEQYFKGIEYPVMKDDVIEHVQAKGADQEIVDALAEHLPDRIYFTNTELMTAYTNEDY
ncbi:MAG: DUF2795 domain-containing protein [Desulfovibrionales bacterium]